MKKLWLICFLIPLAGCNTIHRLLHSTSTPAEHPGPADDYTITGQTSIDYQIIEPVRCAESLVTVRVKRTGETAWRECNQYEVKLDTVGVGGGGVWFKKQVDIDSGGILYLTGRPVAPAGTAYEIRSVRLSGISSHELY